jgi:hypothetical protein
MIAASKNIAINKNWIPIRGFSIFPNPMENTKAINRGGSKALRIRPGSGTPRFRNGDNNGSKTDEK